MEVLRTPDARFENLDGYVFDPHYADVDGLRIHYVDEGPRNGDPVLMLHGEPTWSYLYRKMIPILVEAGFRAIAPDLPGFGRSDKPAEPEAYTFQTHVDWMLGLITALGLTRMTLVGQDWGSLIGLRLVAEHPDLFARVVMANGFLPTGDAPPNESWFKFRDATQKAAVFDIARFVNSGCVTNLSDSVRAAYDAPFPEERYKVAARRFPQLVPVSPDDPAAEQNRAAWTVLSAWEKPFLTAFSDQDKIFRGLDGFLQKVVPGTKGMPHATIKDAGHFLQEDKGEELARVIVTFLEQTKDV
ncbi:MAG: haloalkane dehalogenase [Actinomycetota bacterium]|nr:haloalkane dehalogenase [Actinomycetota bacterium]